MNCSSQLLRSLVTLAAFAATLGATLPVEAGVFSVTPVRMFMGPRDRAIAVTLTNEGDSEIVLQADINTWTQKPDGTDVLTLTEDLILSPPIIKLAPRGRQVVRLALLKPADASRQLTYRIIVREVPEVVAQKEGVQLPIALALSMPVFITPPVAKREVGCELVRTSSGQAEAACSNSGSAYAQVRELSLQRDGQTLASFEGGAYMLPGARKVLPLKSERALAAGPAQLGLTFDDGQSIKINVTLP